MAFVSAQRFLLTAGGNKLQIHYILYSGKVSRLDQV
jgi:hypothetical protein